MGSFLGFLIKLPLIIIQLSVSQLCLSLNQCVTKYLQFANSLLNILVGGEQGMDKVRQLLRLRSGKVKEGQKTDDLHFIPVYQRSDGVTIKLGAFVTRINDQGSSVFNVRNIAVQSDLQKVLAILVPSECVPVKNKPNDAIPEEMTVDINDVDLVKEKGICPDIARNGMEDVSKSASSCPYHIQKFIRKHQLSSTMRREVQKFLSGFSMAGSSSLGCVNWQLDPVILGLERETDFSMEYRVERSVDNISHMDLLMGKLWDVRNISGTDGYRIILTLELLVDSNQELFLKMHATLLSGKVDPLTYRSICLRDTSNLHMLCNRRLSDITNNRTRRLSDITNNASNAVITPGQTLAWDEFQTHSAGNSPFRQCGASGGGPSATVSLDDMFALGSGGSLPTFPTASTSAFHTLEKLLSAIPQSQIVFNSPIKEVSGEYTGVSTTVTGPNTSTPADDLDDNQSHHLTTATPHSSPSLPDHKPEQETRNQDVSLDEELESLKLKENKLQVTFAPTDIPTKMQRISPKLIRSSPDDDHEEDEEDFVKEKFVEELDVPDRGLADDLDSMKPSPNISTDFEDCNSPNKAAIPKWKGAIIPDNILNSLSPLVNPTKSGMTTPPKQHTSFKRVQDYIQSLPSPQHFSANTNSLIKSPEGQLQGNKSNGSMAEDDTTSQCSGSHSIVSRQSELSSLTGSRVGRGTFYGSASFASANMSSGPMCPFPEEWQNSIPECIENDDEID